MAVAGNSVEINAEDCFSLRGATAAACCCKKSELLVAIDSKLCFICGDEDANIIYGDRVTLIPNQPAVSCDDFAQAGIDKKVTK
jgi:hypothetical protein